MNRAMKKTVKAVKTVKAAKSAEKKPSNRRSIQDQLDYIELLMATLLHVFANAEVCVGESKKSAKKSAKKAKK